MKNKFSHLNAKLKPLNDNEDSSSEVLKVDYIEVTHEEYKRMFKKENEVME